MSSESDTMTWTDFRDIIRAADAAEAVYTAAVECLASFCCNGVTHVAFHPSHMDSYGFDITVDRLKPPSDGLGTLEIRLLRECLEKIVETRYARLCYYRHLIGDYLSGEETVRLDAGLPEKAVPAALK